MYEVTFEFTSTQVKLIMPEDMARAVLEEFAAHRQWEDRACIYMIPASDPEGEGVLDFSGAYQIQIKPMPQEGKGA